ncbi:MAG TPA: hypothetical protein VF223_04115 [Trebonia sp.]
MKTTHVWVRNKVTGGTWQCPVGVLDEMAKKGWEPCDAPPPNDPTTADARAWRAAKQASAAPAEPKSTKAAARGKTEGSVSGDA